MSSAVHGKTIENVRNRINVRLVSNKKDCFKWRSKLSYMSQKKFGNDLVGIRTSRGTLTYNKPACVGSINN